VQTGVWLGTEEVEVSAIPWEGICFFTVLGLCFFTAFAYALLWLSFGLASAVVIVCCSIVVINISR